MSDEGRDHFFEEQTPHLRFGLRLRRTLVSRRTAWQTMLIAESEDFGRFLALDGRLMVTERDERFYHEMVVHPALLTHPRPRDVLIVGGGDGGAAREVLRHACVESLRWVELDEEVVHACREHLPSLGAGVFDDPRVRLHVMPAERLVPELEAALDVIVMDSTDPHGPARALFEEPFFHACRRALRPGGVLVTQAGAPFFYPQELRDVRSRLGRVFAHVRPYLGQVPCFCSGTCAYVAASDAELELPEAELVQRYAARGLRTVYYTPQVQRASGIIPPALVACAPDEAGTVRETPAEEWRRR